MEELFSDNVEHWLRFTDEDTDSLLAAVSDLFEFMSSGSAVVVMASVGSTPIPIDKTSHTYPPPTSSLQAWPTIP